MEQDKRQEERVPSLWKVELEEPLKGKTFKFQARDLSRSGIFLATIFGLIAGTFIGIITEFYTAENKGPAQAISEQSLTGPATNIIAGLATGMRSTAYPLIALAAAIVLAYWQANLYGIAIAALGMLSTTGIQLAVDGHREEVIVSDGGMPVAAAASERPAPQGTGDITTTMPGLIVELLVSEGETVEKGTPLFVIEAMKMQSEIAAPIAGTIEKIYISRDDHVEPGETLLAITQQ